MPAYSLPELPYDVAALEPHYPAEILALHHDKHHAGYVTGLNATLDQLAEARASGNYSSLVGLEKTMAFNLSGHVLHTLFWQNLIARLSKTPGRLRFAGRPLDADGAGIRAELDAGRVTDDR